MRRLRAAYPLTGGLAMALVAALAPASTADSAAAPREIVVKGATIWTVSESGTIDRADLLVRDGKVAAVVTNIDPPRGALVIDGTGKHITPGLIDAHSHTAIDGGVNEGSNNVTAEVRISVLGSGSRLIGGTLACDLARDEVEQMFVDGFFPEVDHASRPDRRRSGLVGLGLPYVAVSPRFQKLEEQAR